MLEVIKINSLSDVKNKELRERAKRARSDRSQEFIAVINGSESAFLSYEDWSDKSLGFIYEIFVLPNYREKCIGAKLVSYAEALAIELGCTSVQLDANAFDRSVNTEWLVSWYVKKGYVQQADNSERMEKALTKVQF